MVKTIPQGGPLQRGQINGASFGVAATLTVEAATLHRRSMQSAPCEARTIDGTRVICNLGFLCLYWNR